MMNDLLIFVMRFQNPPCFLVAALIDGVFSFWDSLKSSPKESGVDPKLMLSRDYFLEVKRSEPWRGKRFLNDGRRP